MASDGKKKELSFRFAKAGWRKKRGWGRAGMDFLLSFLYCSLFCLFVCGLGSKAVYSFISCDYEFLFVLSCHPLILIVGHFAHVEYDAMMN